MQKDRRPNVGAFKNPRDAVSDCVGLASVLLFNFNQDPKRSMTILKANKSLGIRLRGQPSLHADTPAVQQSDNRRSIPLAKVD
ncbi:hypothetical protein [Paracoccus nototheniae]|uniref:Uncharacterized protein n=1 Tax=Paracoccus nototheniae TaxID=2489002 RepID=A0ABW4DWS7_9RHOB|nr:hypothetical protein [Paracoccus nototheniae]